jgi:hypothetical protein
LLLSCSAHKRFQVVGGIPISQGRHCRVLVIGGDANQCPAEKQNRDKQESISITDALKVDIGKKKEDKKRRGKDERAHRNALDQQEAIFHLG